MAMGNDVASIEDGGTPFCPRDIRQRETDDRDVLSVW